jgi:ABC-type nitrate/sulfonate/bicarbonate transport system ATPase subunit
MSDIDIREVVISYDHGQSRQKIIDGVSMEIKKGEFVCIVGQSGCGKTTLLNVIAGLLKPESGQILYRGRPSPDSVRIGYVFQFPRLLPWRTVQENLQFVLKETDAGVKDKIAHVLEMVGLGGYEKYYPHQISGGMQARVSIARALVIDPDILLMDEPFSHLDQITAKKLREDVVKLWAKTKMTVIFVTHDLHEAVYLADRVYVLGGRPATIRHVENIDIMRPREYDGDEVFKVYKKLANIIYSIQS